MKTTEGNQRDQSTRDQRRAPSAHRARGALIPRLRRGPASAGYRFWASARGRPAARGCGPSGRGGWRPCAFPLEVRVRDRTRRAETPWAARWRQRRHRGPATGASRQWTRPKEINAASHAAAPRHPALQPHHPQQPHRPEPEKSARRSPSAWCLPAHRGPLLL